MGDVNFSYWISYTSWESWWLSAVPTSRSNQMAIREQQELQWMQSFRHAFELLFPEIRHDQWSYSQELFGNGQIWFESMMALRQGVCIASSNLWDGGEKKKRSSCFCINEMFQNCIWLFTKRKKSWTNAFSFRQMNYKFDFGEWLLFMTNLWKPAIWFAKRLLLKFVSQKPQ